MRERIQATLLLLAAAAALSCAGAAPTPRPAEGDSVEPRQGSGGEALLELAEQALARGELDTAEQRFARVLVHYPRSPRANTGAGRVALSRGDAALAREHFERALASDPEGLEATIALADLEEAAGRTDTARELLTRAIRADFQRPQVHARLARLTGTAPRGPEPTGAETARDLALAHPYDPRALLGAGRLLAAEGRGVEAVAFLEKTVWLADLDPAAATQALRLLPTLDEGWSRRRTVPVLVYADETLRGHAAWRFRMRLLWLTASSSLEPLVSVRFVPVAMRTIDLRSVSPGMESLFPSFVALTSAAPRRGILAGFTEREAPAGRQEPTLGIAEFLGRRVFVRLRPGETQSRVLAHEVLHLYGAVHVSDQVESIMNTRGVSGRLDPANARVVRSMRARRFSSEGFRGDILARIDLDETIEAYAAALQLNLAFRQLGMTDALEARGRSRYVAAREAERAMRLDPQLADVSRMLARLLLADERRAEALLLFDLAARLYGRDTRMGRVASAEARALERQMERLYGE